LQSSTPIDRQQHAGFSLPELIIVLAISSILAGFAVLNLAGILPGMNANSAMHMVMGQLRAGRELAMSERRNIEISFVGDNHIQLARFEVPNGRTVLSTVELENRIEFQLFDGVPDTPDGFGNEGAVDFGGSDALIYLSDGTLVDDEGNPLNGTVFFGLPEHAETARAVTILGATGRVRGYRWNGDSWIQ
jgi:prepilin-type N-terminal cleavage/methylation domain-containing protein